jgi:hypothetical protein
MANSSPPGASLPENSLYEWSDSVRAHHPREGVMRKTRFSEEQMVKILREADKGPVAEIAKKHGISDQTIYGWRQRFGKLNDPALSKNLRIPTFGLFLMLAKDFLNIRHVIAFILTHLVYGEYLGRSTWPLLLQSRFMP